ncbi:sugar transferase [Euzebya sp.]|uniref:sugar transferase n=1 Tax=Euzebya sp. TaxID=1971409 RepID=UPI0035148448
MATKLVLAGLDLVVLSVIVVALNLVFFGDALAFAQSQVSGSASLASALLVVSTPVLWRQLKLYRLVGGWGLGDAVKAAATGAGALLLVIFSLVVVFKFHEISRMYLANLAVAVGTWIAASRLTADRVLRQRRAAGKGNLRVLMVGGGIGGERFLSALRSHPELGMDAIGYVGHDVPGVDPGHRLGNIDDLRSILATRVVDEVVICLPFEQWARIRDCAQIAEEQGKTVRMPMWMVEELGTRSRLDHVGGVPLLSLVHTPDDVVQKGVKRAVDFIGALAGLVAFAPLLALAAAAIKLTDGGPIFFRQTRVGLHGRHFPILKLRTMCVDAEDRLAEVAHLNERSAVTFKATHDPRVTRIGRILRRTSLDEVPQFWNVLTGDMSLVGPRPALPREVTLYDPRHRRRLSVKPGVTGLWQVSGREDSSFESWVDLDLSYIDRWSPLTDLRIIAQTIPAMLRGTGA